MPGDRATRTVLQVGGGVNARGSLGGSSHPLCLTPALGFQALVFLCVGMCWEVREGLGRLEHTVGALPDIIPPSKPLLSLPVSLPLLLSLSASTFPLLLSPSLSLPALPLPVSPHPSSLNNMYLCRCNSFPPHIPTLTRRQAYTTPAPTPSSRRIGPPIPLAATPPAAQGTSSTASPAEGPE